MKAVQRVGWANVNVTALARALPQVRALEAYRLPPPTGWRFRRVELEPGAVRVELERE